MEKEKFFLWLNTWFASYLKVYLTAVSLLIANNGGSVFGIAWQSFANAAVVCFIPLIINSANPKDKRYGKAKPEKIYNAPKDASIKN